MYSILKAVKKIVGYENNYGFTSFLIVLCLISFMKVAKSQDEIRIGNQIWKTENLNTETFNNGEVILQAQSDQEWLSAIKNKQPAWCYYENNTDNGIPYGKLYNWYAVTVSRNVCPVGYRIPGYQDWQLLLKQLENDSRGVSAVLLKSTYGWRENKNGKNQTGFSGFPSGIRNSIGEYRNRGTDGFWWSSSKYPMKSAWYFLINHELSFARCFQTSINNGLAVRCLKVQENN